MTGKRKPVTDEIETFFRRQTDLGQRFLKGGLPPEQTLAGMQLLIEGKPFNGNLPIPAQNNPGTAKNRPRPASQPAAATNDNPYANEQTKQAWYYPKGFAKPTVATQIERVQKLWPGIDVSHVSLLAERFSSLPDGFDFVEVKPKIEYLGRKWEMADPYGLHYGPLVEQVLGMIAASRSFVNYRKGQMNENYIRLHAEVLERLRQIEASTPGDVLVMPVSLGNLYAGYSARNCRWDSLNKGYLPNGAAHVGCSLLVMPDRLTAWEQLIMDCAGDEWNWGASGQWLGAPYFDCNDDRLGFSAGEAYYAHGDGGGVVSFPGVPA